MASDPRLQEIQPLLQRGLILDPARKLHRPQPCVGNLRSDSAPGSVNSPGEHVGVERGKLTLDLEDFGGPPRLATTTRPGPTLPSISRVMRWTPRRTMHGYAPARLS